jgi:hypothetical protein
VRAGLAVIEAVGRLPAREDLRVRLAVVGDLIGEGSAQERGVGGETPNLAARLQVLAEPSTLVIGEATRRQIGGLFNLEDLGLQALAGFAEPQPAWRVIGESAMLSRFEALRSGETATQTRGFEAPRTAWRWHAFWAIPISGYRPVGPLSRCGAAMPRPFFEARESW